MINTNSKTAIPSISYQDLIVKINDILNSNIVDISPANLIKFVSEKDEPKSKTLVLNWVLSNLPLLFAQDDDDFDYAISHEDLFIDNTEAIAEYLLADTEIYHELFTKYPKQFAFLLSNYSYTFCDYSSLYNCFLLQKIIDDLNTLPYNKDYTLIAFALTNINSEAGPEYSKIKNKITIRIPEYYYTQRIRSIYSPFNNNIELNSIDPDIIITLFSKIDVDYLLTDLLRHRIDSRTPIIITNDKIKGYIASYISSFESCTYSKELNNIKVKLQTLIMY